MLKFQMFSKKICHTVALLVLSAWPGYSTSLSDQPITIYSVYFTESGMNVDWRTSLDELLKLGEWTPQQSATAIDTAKLSGVALEQIIRSTGNPNVVVDNIQLLNLAFSPSTTRSTDTKLGNRWFCVVTAKPTDYKAGKALPNEHLYTVVVLLNGKIIEPEMSSRDDINVKKNDKPNRR